MHHQILHHTINNEADMTELPYHILAASSIGKDAFAVPDDGVVFIVRTVNRNVIRQIRLDRKWGFPMNG